MKGKVKLYISRCKGCYLCVSVCPTKALMPSKKIGAKGYAVIEADLEKCIGCGSCYQMCPDQVFEIVEEEGA